MGISGGIGFVYLLNKLSVLVGGFYWEGYIVNYIGNDDKCKWLIKLK